MVLFDKLKKKEIKVIDSINKSDWFQVFSANLGKMMVIQQNASEYVVKGQNWNVDFTKGIISFGDDVYPVQMIGTESDQSNTWNWGWNNVNNLSDSLITLANEALSLGEAWELDPLRIPRFELNDIFNGHNLSIVACGLSKENYFYYRGPHSGGAIFMAVGSVPEEVFSSINIQEFANLTMQCVQQFPVDHKIFTEAFLEWNKTPFTWNGNVLTAHFNQDLFITFEQSGQYYRISAMDTQK